MSSSGDVCSVSVSRTRWHSNRYLRVARYCAPSGTLRQPSSPPLVRSAEARPRSDSGREESDRERARGKIIGTANRERAKRFDGGYARRRRTLTSSERYQRGSAPRRFLFRRVRQRCSGIPSRRALPGETRVLGFLLPASRGAESREEASLSDSVPFIPGPLFPQLFGR